MTSFCPCCGSVLTGIEWSRELWMVRTTHGAATLGSRRQVEIFDLLWKRLGHHGFTAERIIDLVYADDPSGGAQRGTIRAIVKRMRRVLTPIGIVIDAAGADAGYKIVFVTPEQATAAATQRANKHSRISASKPMAAIRNEAVHR